MNSITPVSITENVYAKQVGAVPYLILSSLWGSNQQTHIP